MSNEIKLHLTTNASDDATDAPTDDMDTKAWSDMDAFVDDEDFAAVMETKFPREAAIVRRSGMNRRSFLKVMGASMVLGGLSLTGCAPALRGEDEIRPYVRQPEEVVPGQPLFFASTMVLGGYATGVVIETDAGRPHRIEGNPTHPASLGGSNMMQLASILELYNPSRSTRVRQNGDDSTMADFMSAFNDVRDNLGDGAGLRVLTEVSTSPTLAQQMSDLLDEFPEAQWYQYDPAARDAVFDGAQMAFGEPVNTTYDFSRANVVLSLDADFLMSMPGSLRYARDYTAARKVRDATTSMNRMYVVESTPTNTGTVAEHSLRMKASHVEVFARALADALGVDGGAAAEDAPWDEAFFNAVVEDLQANEGSSLVIPGDQQTPVTHALAHAINAALGNVGTTVNYTESVFPNPVNAQDNLSELMADMAAGDVDALVIIGGNPAYSTPADIPFGEAVGRVPFSVHLSLYNNETSQATTWHIPHTHYIEAWGDARAYDGTASVIQPPIAPLYENAISTHEMIGMLMGDDRSDYDIVREYWQGEYSGGEFDRYWKRALHNGVLADTAFESISPSLQGDLGSMIEESAAGVAGDGLEVVFNLDPAIYDGRFVNNSWLQEAPHPLTKISWDNVAMMSQHTADDLGLSNEDVIELSLNGRTMQAPVWVTHGHPDDVVSVALGYGTGISSELDEGLSFNAYQIRTSNNLWFADGVQVNSLGRTYPLANTQKEFETFGTKPVRHATLAQFAQAMQENEEEGAYGLFHEEKIEASFLDDVQPVPEGDYQWGMTIDLTSCIGCNACMIGCQSENNIPTVGKPEVLQERDMHWIRVDRYYSDGGDDSESFQPMPCQHCENAPCEIVCPVQATVHDHEGLNQMIYNRCIGTRSCSSNCPYSVRRFNFKEYNYNEPDILAEQRNPDVTVRMRGVMEKCTYCWQRINSARIVASKENRPIQDGEVIPACAAACPTQAIQFGNINDSNAAVSLVKAQPHNYGVLAELNTVPRTSYLGRISNPNEALYDESASDEDH